MTAFVIAGLFANARAQSPDVEPPAKPSKRAEEKAAAERATQPPAAKSSDKEKENPGLETWGAVTPGAGMLLHRSKIGELDISAYALIRYLNQLPAGEVFLDHLGRPHHVDARHDIWAHRIMVHLKGWLGLPKLRYQITFWTVNTTDQTAIFAVLGYQFHRAFSLYGGLNALPGTRTLQGSHPYWLGHDRVMADEYFRPYFTHGIWASGEVYPGLWYQGMVGNNLSALGITATQLTRDFAYAASIWWMPTTYEFGPNGSFDDYEWHEELATRFGVSGVNSREDSFVELTAKAPENTTIRLADSLNVFELGALADGVSVRKVRYRLLSADAGLKYKGIFLQGSYFLRWLGDFVTDGPIPVTSIVDQGFYLQAAFYPVKQKLEAYGATSWVFGDKDAGFKTEYEWLAGVNWFFANTRDIRLNGQIIRMNRSPVSSSFGYYVGGLKGETVSLAVSINF
ncbi:MAG: hypothetical protein HOV81_35050 [Kofleriaceae bacterium]|nr:hypothetical protein [Kofleriaceae bacterium]